MPKGVTSPIPVTTTRRILIAIRERTAGAASDLVWGIRQRAAQLCVSMKLTASFTVTIFSAASSGISHPNSSSKAITSSTVSRLSAPRSSMKLAFSVTFDSSTPRCSTTIFLTRSATSLIRSYPQWLAGNHLLRTKRLALSAMTGAAPHRPPGPPSGKRVDIRVTGRSHSMFPRHCKSAAQGSGSMASYHDHTAIDVQGLARDICRFGARQVNHRRSYLFRRAEPAGRNRFDQPRALLRRQFVGHRRHNETRRDAVHGNAASGNLGGDRFRHADHRGLCRGIVRLPCIATDPDDRADPDDATMAATNHAVQQRAGQPELGRQIDLQNRPPVLVLHSQRQDVTRDPGVVDE